MEKEAVLPEEKSRIARTRHLAFEQQAEPIDFVGVCILAEPTVGPAVSAERGGPSPQCLPKENKRGRVREELVKVAVVYRNPQP
jgi:hypothetical protein